MDEDFDDILNDLLGEGYEDGPRAPDFRVTIRDNTLTLTQWAPWLANGGPLGNLFRARERHDVTIADCTVVGEDKDELVVRYRSAGASRPQAEDTLLGWAETVGYRRAWLPGRVEALSGGAERLVRASVKCPTCAARWSDANPEFWLAIRESHQFPNICMICGGLLPQWTVRSRSPRQATRSRRDPAARRRSRSTASDSAPSERPNK